MKDDKKINIPNNSLFGSSPFGPNLLKDALDNAAKQLGLDEQRSTSNKTAPKAAPGTSGTSDTAAHKAPTNRKTPTTPLTHAPEAAPAPTFSYEKGALLLDTYRIESDPIHGGMGSVWRVHHSGWNLDLAMKRPQPKMFAGEASREKFYEECQHWINLGLHPNIVSCYYVREIEGVPTIFSEWMENGSLKNRIRDKSLYLGSDTEVRKRLLDIAIQFARGLHYAHSAGLIHQDVKPDNLLLTNDWQAKVADFGLSNARAALTALDGNPTLRDSEETMYAVGGGYTPAYCSIEQMNGIKLTRRTDIYSWAVSVMEMYLGERPWPNGVVAGVACREYMSNCMIQMPEALQSLLAICMETNPDDRPHDFAEIEKELLNIYRELANADYPRPVPTSASDNAESLNNRAVSLLDIGKENEAVELLKKGAKKRHFDSTLNLILYRWRTATCSDQDLKQEVDDLEKLYPERHDDLDQVRQQILMEACGRPDPPRFRTIIPQGFWGNTMSNMVLHDGKVIAVIRKRWRDGQVYNYVCHFEPTTGRLLAQYPPEDVQPGIRVSAWENSAKLNLDCTLLTINSRIEEHTGVFDVIRQQKTSGVPFPYARRAGEWLLHFLKIWEVFEEKNEIKSMYKDEVPLIGKKSDGEFVCEVISAQTGKPVIRVVTQKFSWISGTQFLIHTKTDAFSILDISENKVIPLIKRGRQDGKTVLKSIDKTLIITPTSDYSHGEVTQYEPGQYMVRIYGHYFTLPDLKEIDFPARKDNHFYTPTNLKETDFPARKDNHFYTPTNLKETDFHTRKDCVRHAYPRIMDCTIEHTLILRELINRRVLLTLPLPVMPYDSSIPNTIIQDYDNERALFFKPSSLAGWAILDLPVFPSEVYPQMNYRISVPVTADEAILRKNAEQMQLESFMRANAAGKIRNMIDIYREAVSKESTGFETLHKMNEHLSACCTKTNLLKVVNAPMNLFTERQSPPSYPSLPPRSSVSFSGRCYVFQDDTYIKRAEYPSGRVTNVCSLKSLNTDLYYVRLDSICFGHKEEIYAIFSGNKLSGRDRYYYRIFALGTKLSDKELLTGDIGSSYSGYSQLISVTEDNRFLLFSRHDDVDTLMLLDIQKKEVIRKLIVNNIVNYKDSFKANDSLSMLCNSTTALELLWDYDPAPIEKVSPDTVPNAAMRISDGELEKYYGEGGVDCVEIPEGITLIAASAFKDCSLIRSVIIPEGVKYISSEAFKNCTRLEMVDIRSHDLKAIGANAFSNCSELSDFRMAENKMTSICKETFAGCKKLKKITIPEGIVKIEESAFSFSGLEECKLPSTLKTIGARAFFHTYIREIELPAGLETLGKAAFAYTHLRSVTIPSSIDTLPGELFDSCRELEEICNNGSIRTIELGALRDCSGLKSVQVACGAVVRGEAFADDFPKRDYPKTRAKTIEKPVRIRAMCWDVFRHEYVHMGYVNFIPVISGGV